MGGLVSKPKAATPPPPTPPAEIPDPDNALTKANKRRDTAVKVSTSGRDSTLLSSFGGNTSSKFGG